jgi:CRISPR-associated endonuclease/helicase Cas3
VLLSTPEANQAIAGIPGGNPNIVLSAVIGHHLQADRAGFATNKNVNRNVFSLLSHGISDVLNFANDRIGLSTDWFSHDDSLWCYSGTGVSVIEAAQTARKQLKKFSRTEWKDGAVSRLLVAVRAALIVADSVGSGLIRISNESNRATLISEWVRSAFTESAVLTGDAINAKVINPRIEQINASLQPSGREFRWADFQSSADELSDRALLLAGCGSGKTLAAWRWIRSRAEKSPVSRVIFLYPTRATATEGFRDYVSWAPEAEAAMVHGTSGYDLSGMFDNPDPRSGRDFTTDDRLFAIGYWTRRIFSATVDQFLGFMQHSYRSMCLLPMLVDSVVVFDEVHSFDKSLFSALKRFLDAFDVPVLCMTASLPDQRKADLQACGLQVFPENPEAFADLKARSDMPRYRVTKVASKAEAEQLVCRALASDKRVLWVVNTVDRCQQLAEAHSAICYHSRFTLADRKDRHAEVIAAFQTSTGPVLAITTQVCEMSLDLDAHVLVTETSPIPALIQRMGRCNRHATPGDPAIGEVIIYDADSFLPYDESDLVGVGGFIDAVDGVDIGQSHLQQLLEELGPTEVEVEKYAAFLESGPWAKSHEASLRDESDFNVQAILDRDIDEFLVRTRRRETTDGFVLPAPKALAVRDDRLPRWLSTVSSDSYTARFGLTK